MLIKKLKTIAAVACMTIFSPDDGTRLIGQTGSR